ncbi:hypothetical protein MTO96_037775 [Rhipicephalus appendiculatus]
MSKSEFLPDHGMSSTLMAMYLEVREKPGWHAEYPYGSPKYGEETKPYPAGAYNGLTHRVFLFKSDNEPTSLEVTWNGKNKTWHNRVLVDKNGKCHCAYSDETSKNKEVTVFIKEAIVDQGDFYSFAVRLTDTKYFQTYVNDKPGFKANMQNITLPAQWEWILKAQNDTLLSIHFSAEEGNNFPIAGLGTSYEAISKFKTPPGSTLFVEFSVINPTKPISIGVGSSALDIEYPSVSGIKADQKVTAFIRNSPDFWMLSTSFDPVPKQIPRGARDAQSDMVYFSDNCHIMRMNHVSGF